MINGIINVYKEKGYTSFDVVAKLRGILKTKKIGHTGTLDPDAEGVLPVCLGKATKVCDLLTDKSKEYEAVLLLGKVTDTQDITGTVLEEKDVKVTEEAVRETVLSFVGDYMQIPPMYSALKVNGKKLCDLAREGKTVERQARLVKILTIDILDVTLPRVRMRVHCSKGTYIRTLCKDIGEFLGCGAAMKTLVRTRVSEFFLEQALTLGQIEQAVKEGKIQDYLIPIDAMFSDLKDCVVSDEALRLLLNGNCIAKKDTSYQMPKDKERVRMYSMENEFYAIYEYRQSEDKYFVVKMF